jgi:hypothetical protein
MASIRLGIEDQKIIGDFSDILPPAALLQYIAALRAPQQEIIYTMMQHKIPT